MWSIALVALLGKVERASRFVFKFNLVLFIQARGVEVGGGDPYPSFSYVSKQFLN